MNDANHLPEEVHRGTPSPACRRDLNALFAETETRVLREDFTFLHRREAWQIILAPVQRRTISGDDR